MFVNIIRGKHKSLYQCDRLHIRSEKEGEFQIDMELDGGRCVSAIVDKAVPEELGVYVMNDQGRTIDTIFRKEAA